MKIHILSSPYGFQIWKNGLKMWNVYVSSTLTLSFLNINNGILDIRYMFTGSLVKCFSVQVQALETINLSLGSPAPPLWPWALNSTTDELQDQRLNNYTEEWNDASGWMWLVGKKHWMYLSQNTPTNVCVGLNHSVELGCLLICMDQQWFGTLW